MKIIGIAGPSASGKGTVVEYFTQNLGFIHYSVSDYLTQQIQAQGKEVNRDTMRDMANHLRAKYGASYIVDQLYTEAMKNGKNAIIESIRTVGELEILQEKSDFLLLSVDADQHLRYERAVLRNSSKDQVTWEQFQEQEALEANNPNPSQQNILACQKMANIHIDNNGTLEELYQQIEQISLK